MSLTRQDVALIQSLISRALNQRQPPIARDGMAVNGAYNPVDGTIGSKLCDTDAMFGSGDQPTAVPRVPQAHAVYGDQYGARGGERTTLIVTQHGFDSLYTYDEDDSPGAPSGEIWRVHRNAAGEIDSFSKWTNDGPTEGDGLGGYEQLVGALLSILTAAGLSIRMDDNLGLILLAAGSTANPENAVIRKSDLDAALAAQASQFNSQLATWAAAHVQPGTGGTGPTLTAVTSTGSTKVQSG